MASAIKCQVPASSSYYRSLQHAKSLVSASNCGEELGLNGKISAVYKGYSVAILMKSHFTSLDIPFQESVNAKEH